jgi:hypothetical protein
LGLVQTRDHEGAYIFDILVGPVKPINEKRKPNYTNFSCEPYKCVLRFTITIWVAPFSFLHSLCLSHFDHHFAYYICSQVSTCMVEVIFKCKRVQSLWFHFSQMNYMCVCVCSMLGSLSYLSYWFILFVVCLIFFFSRLILFSFVLDLFVVLCFYILSIMIFCIVHFCNVPNKSPTILIALIKYMCNRNAWKKIWFCVNFY